MLRLKTFGGLTLHSNAGTPAGAATQRRRLALLVLLARAGQSGVSREKLLAYLWPESDTEKARGGLAQAMYSLKRDLGSDQLFLGTTDLRLNPEVLTSDVEDFCSAFSSGRYEEAVRLYAGPFLDGIHISDADEFERWMEAQRSELANDFRASLERLAKAADTTGDHSAAVGWWRKLAAVDPLNSRVALGLMHALAGAGDRAGAIQHGRVYEALLRQELDVTPDPEIARLAEHLRQQPPAAAPSPAPVSPSQAQLPTPEPAAPAVEASPSSGIPGGTVDQPKSRPRPVRPAPLLVGLLFLLGLTALVGYLSRKRSTSGPARKMVAVLPFQNLGDPSQEYFADGLTEEVTARLAGLSGLGVISRTSSMQYKKTSKSLKQIAQELGVSYVLEGSVRWERQAEGRPRVRVTPQLIQVSDDSHLWANRYDAEIADVFQVQGDIAEQVASALDVALQKPEREALSVAPTKNPEAYDEYLRGSVYLDRSWGDRKILEAALESFQKAVQLDPVFALAHAKLGIGHTMMFRLGYDDDEARLAKAKQAVDAAFRARPDLIEGHLALGYYYYWGLRNYPRARTEFLLVRKQRPRDPETSYGLAAVERRQGKWADAVEHFREAAEQDPRSSSKAWDCALAFFFTRDYPTAERYLNRAIALAPDWAFPYTTKARMYLSWTGDIERSRKVLRDIMGKTDLATLVTGVNDVSFLLTGDSVLRPTLSRITLKEFGGDSLYYYMWKGQWYGAEGDVQRERAAWDSMRTVAAAELRVRQKYERAHPAQAEQAYLAQAIADAGLHRKAEALRGAAKALELLPLSQDAAWGADRAIYLAQIYQRLGEPDRAIQQLEQLLSIPSPLSITRLRVDPTWQPLHQHPVFQRLLSPN